MIHDQPLTTTQAARLSEMSVGTIVKFADSGILPSYRIPGDWGRTDRRITRPAFRAFLVAHGIPTGRFDMWAALTNLADEPEGAGLLHPRAAWKARR